MPSIDVDATLIAIRIASYGNQMDFTSQCPHCKTDQEVQQGQQTRGNKHACSQLDNMSRHSLIKTMPRMNFDEPMHCKTNKYVAQICFLQEPAKATGQPR